MIDATACYRLLRKNARSVQKTAFTPSTEKEALFVAAMLATPMRDLIAVTFADRSDLMTFHPAMLAALPQTERDDLVDLRDRAKRNYMREIRAAFFGHKVVDETSPTNARVAWRMAARRTA